MPLTSLTIKQTIDRIAEQHEKKTGPEDATEDVTTLKLNDTQILVVDDNEINLLIAENFLSFYGGEVTTASSGVQAVERVQTFDYDIVFMDHMMPEVDGIDAKRMIRALGEKKYQTLPIIALTANVVGDVRDLMLENGMNDFLAKPMETQELERILVRWRPKQKWSTTA